MKKFIFVLFLFIMSLDVFAFESATFKKGNNAYKKMNPISTAQKEVKENIIKVAISNIHIGTLPDGRWYYGFYLHNKSKNIILKKDQVKVQMNRGYANGQINIGIERNILPQKKILVRHFFKHEHRATTLNIKIYTNKSELKQTLLASKEINIEGIKLKGYVNFKNVHLINSKNHKYGDTLKYCVENKSSYSLASELEVTVYFDHKSKAVVKTNFLLKRKNAKCGVINLGIVPSSRYKIYVYLKDRNSFQKKSIIASHRFTLP